MNMPSLVFGRENVLCFLTCNPARAIRMMVEHKRGKRFTHNHANIQRQTWLEAGRTTGTIQDDDMIGICHDKIARLRVRNHMLEIR